VTPVTARTQRLDHGISLYQPKGCVAPHRHKVRAQISPVLEGDRHVVRRHDVIHIPPWEEHAIYDARLKLVAG
jgi:hypothetical protein